MLWALTRHYKQALQKRSKSKAVVHKKTFGLFAQPKKFHSRTMLFFCQARVKNQHSKFRIFFTGQGGKVSLVKILFPQLREACFEATKI